MKRSLATGRRTDISMQTGLSILVVAGSVALLAATLMLLVGREQLLRRMRAFSKRVINPVVMRFAGSARSPFAVIRHVGRRSGRAYETPLLLAPVAEGFVIELTYGFEVDWYRNVVAAGHCTIRWHGREYRCDEFEPVDAETGLQAFPAVLRLPLRMFGARDFVKMMSG